MNLADGTQSLQKDASHAVLPTIAEIALRPSWRVAFVVQCWFHVSRATELRAMESGRLGLGGDCPTVSHTAIRHFES